MRSFARRGCHQYDATGSAHERNPRQHSARAIRRASAARIGQTQAPAGAIAQEPLNNGRVSGEEMINMSLRPAHQVDSG